MKRAALILALLLIPSRAFATWAFVQSVLSASTGSGGTSTSPGISPSITAGQVAVCVIMTDETGAGTTDGDNNQVTSMSDSGGNTWFKAKEFDNMQTSTADDGAVASAFYTKATATASSVTINFSSATTIVAVTCSTWTVGGTVSVAAGSSSLANDAADPGSMTVATGVSQPHLFIRVSACEAITGTYTVTAGYTAFDHTASQTDSGTAATSGKVRGEWKIETASTSTASDPTSGVGDCASVMFGLDDSADAAASGGNGSWGAWRRR